MYVQLSINPYYMWITLRGQSWTSRNEEALFRDIAADERGGEEQTLHPQGQTTEQEKSGRGIQHPTIIVPTHNKGGKKIISVTIGSVYL